MCAVVIWHAKEKGNARASQYVNDLTRRCSFACEKLCVSVRVLYDGSRGLDARVRFHVLELKVK